jgi:hypothetical protein
VPDHLEADGEPFLEVVAEYALEGIVREAEEQRLPSRDPHERLAQAPRHAARRRRPSGLVEDSRGGTLRALCGQYSDERGTLVFVGEAYVPSFLGRWLDDATRAFARTLAVRDATSAALRDALAAAEADGDRRARRRDRDPADARFVRCASTAVSMIAASKSRSRSRASLRRRIGTSATRPASEPAPESK